jgi:hypothetical protein
VGSVSIVDTASTIASGLASLSSDASLLRKISGIAIIGSPEIAISKANFDTYSQSGLLAKIGAASITVNNVAATDLSECGGQLRRGQSHFG